MIWERQRDRIWDKIDRETVIVIQDIETDIDKKREIKRNGDEHKELKGQRHINLMLCPEEITSIKVDGLL